MTTRSPSAFALSSLLHGAVAVLVLGGAWLARKNLPPPPQIFELVAGEGNDFTETVAPKGNPEGGGPTIPPPPKLLPTTVRPDPAPSPPTPAPQRATTAPTRPTTAPSRQTTAPEPNRMTKEEFDKRNNTSRSNQSTQRSQPQTQPPQRGSGPRIDTGKILGNTNSTSRSGAGGTALSRAESDERSAYLSYLVQQLKAAHEKPPGLSDLLRTRVEFRINADGSITGVRVIEGSGNTAFDQSALAAFRQIRLTPPPGGRPITDSVLFRMKDEG